MTNLNQPIIRNVKKGFIKVRNLITAELKKVVNRRDNKFQFNISLELIFVLSPIPAS